MSSMSLLPNVKNKTIQILSGNITTVAYICFQGSPSGKLTNIASKIWTLAIKNNGREVKSTGRRSFEATEPTRVGT